MKIAGFADTKDTAAFFARKEKVARITLRIFQGQVTITLPYTLVRQISCLVFNGGRDEQHTIPIDGEIAALSLFVTSTLSERELFSRIRVQLNAVALIPSREERGPGSESLSSQPHASTGGIRLAVQLDTSRHEVLVEPDLAVWRRLVSYGAHSTTMDKYPLPLSVSLYGVAACMER